MQIFLKSHTNSFFPISSYRGGYGHNRGFTLIELLISVAIIGIITMIVLLKYSSFDSTTLLKGAAYEVALNLREAQVRSVSVVRSNNEDPDTTDVYGKFDFPYGVSFYPDQKTYTLFQFRDLVSLDDNSNPRNGVIDESDGLPSVEVGQVTLERSLQVSDICFMVNNNWNCHSDDPSIERLDISFRRPEFTALFYVKGYGGNEKNISKAQIKVTSTSGSGSFVIEVSRLGQITVTSQ